VSGPFIFIATNRLKPGKLAEERERVPGLVTFLEANEPQLIAFNEYVNKEGTEVAVVQVHPTRTEGVASSIRAERRIAISAQIASTTPKGQVHVPNRARGRAEADQGSR
jgi:hypothetical protein